MRLRLLFIPALFFAFALQAQISPIKWIKKNGPVGGEIKEIEVDPSTGKIFLLDGDHKPYVSTDNGASWQKLTFSGSDNWFYDIEITNGTIFLVAHYDLYASTDGGISFSARMSSTSPYNNAYRLKRMPSSGNLVVLSYDAIYVSGDNGVTWTLKTSSLAKVDTRYLEVNSVDQIFILKPNGAFEVRPFRSTDGGASFSEASTGIPAGHHVLGLYGANNGGNIYSITSSDLFSSANGTSWTSVKTGSISDAIISDYGSLNNSILEFSADGLGMFFIDNVNHKLHSKTLVETSWALQASPFPSGTLSVLSASAKDFPSATTATAFFGTPSGVFKTTTGGASVSENNVGIASVKGVQIISDDRGYLYLRTSDLGLLKSIDNGNNWSKITGLSYDIRHFFSNGEGSSLFAVSDYNVFKRSYDYGSSWFVVGPTGGFVWAGAAGQQKIFGLQNDYVNSGSPLSLYYSSDNANTWTSTPVTVSGLPTSFSIYQETILFASASRMLFLIYDNVAFTSSYYTIDFVYDATGAISSATATKITNAPFGGNIDKMTGANGKLYAYSNASTDQVAVSSDGGLNWVARAVPQSNGFYTVKNGYLFFVDGSLDRVHISRDDGTTFAETSLAAGTDAYSIRDITLDNAGHAYLAFNGDYVYQSENTIVIPDAPATLEQIGITSTAAAIRWVDLNTYDHDIIIERSANGTDFLKVGEASGWDVCNSSGNRGFYIDANLSAGTTYTYRIKAKNAAGESPSTSPVTITTLAACTESIPDNRSWSAINSGTEGYPLMSAPVTVGVKRISAGKYQISDLSLGLTSSSPRQSTFYESCGQTFVSERYDLKPNGNATWDASTSTLKLKWLYCYGTETETITLTLNSNDPAPLQPASLYAYTVSNTSIELKWPSGYYEKTYVIERSTSPSSGFAQIGTASYPTTLFVDNGPLTAGTTYYYRIKSVNGNSTPLESPYSAVVSVPFAKPNFVVANNAITDFNTGITLGSIWADFNGDGLDDYLTMVYNDQNETASPVLFKNLGSAGFEKIVPLIEDQRYFWPSVADYNNDGYADLTLNGQENTVFDIYKGNGDFTFTKLADAQLGNLAARDKELMSSSWAEINNDGLLDLLLLHSDGNFSIYKQLPNNSFAKLPYQDAPVQNEAVLTLWADYNNDGYQDFLVNNSNGTARLYKNNGDETFTNITGNGLTATDFYSAAWGDYNNDGHIDLFCGNRAVNALYKNNGDGTFTENLSTSISEANTSFAASWGDFNNDGYLDLLTTGFARSQTRLFMRDPSVTSSISFKKIISEKITDLSVSHYSAASSDYDKNGLLDMAMSAFIFDDAGGDQFLPTNNNLYQNNNVPGNWSEVKLNPTSGNKESIGARITLTAGGKSQVREITAASSLAARNSSVVHFGLGTSTSIGNIQVRWPNGQTQNFPLPPANQVLVIDEDLLGPVITSKTPAHNGTSISTTTTITLVFDEHCAGMSGKTMNFIKTGETVPFTSVDVSTGVKTGLQYVFTLPVALEPQTEYNVVLEAGAFRDRYANPSAAITIGEWKFTTEAVADITPPAISFTPPASVAKGFSSTTASITATDNVGVSTVVVSIRKISGSTYTDVAATLGSTADTYSFTLSESDYFDATGTEFYITATDAAGNTRRDPAEPGTYQVYLTHTENQSAISSSALGFGGQKTNWKVFAIPFELASPNNSVNNIFDELAGLDTKKDYRLITINDTRDNWKEYPSFITIARGQGYFINIRQLTTIKLYNDLAAPSNFKANLFPMTLKPGWNMIGNPYLTQIDWADVATYNGLSGDAASLVKYTGTGYAASSQILLPYEGGFVNNPTTSDISISIPFDGQTTTGGRTRSFEFNPDINTDEWMLKLNLQQEDRIYEMAAVGMSPDASASFDIFDRVTPPRFFDYLEVNFSHPDHFQKRFTRDVVPAQSSYIWEFTVDSNLGGHAELSWDNSAFYSGAKDLYLLDISNQTLLNMKETASYKFDSNGSSRFRIYYGDNLNIAPERVQLGKAYPNPTNGYTAIRFSLPETGGLNQSVTLDILDAMGRPVGTIKQGRFDPGYHEAAFDATDLMNGFYTYRLTVRNLKGQTTEVNKLIIK